MIDGEIDSALVVTPETIYETRKDGTTVTKQVWVSLDTPIPKVTAEERRAEMPALEYMPDIEPDNSSPQPETTRRYQVGIYVKTQSVLNDVHPQTQRNYIQQYVDRIDEILEAILSREAMPDGAGTWRHCMKDLAVWRCKDCVLATIMCRACMRQYHRENPFHRIEQWNGSYFRHAELWEVGTYLLVQHHAGNPYVRLLGGGVIL